MHFYAMGVILFFKLYEQTLENIEGTINKGQSRETGIIGYTRQRKPLVSESF